MTLPIAFCRSVVSCFSRFVIASCLVLAIASSTNAVQESDKRVPKRGLLRQATRMDLGIRLQPSGLGCRRR